jgi:thioredoxin reductase
MAITAQEKRWDVIIIGGGPAGLSAATVLARSRRQVLLFDEGFQRNLNSHGLHNFITRDGILPPELLRITREELTRYPVSIKKERITAAQKSNDGFAVISSKGRSYYARKLLLATGVTDDVPDIPGFKELWGKSVFHCPFCDGYECKDAEIGLYAQKHNGYGMAIALRHLSSKMTLFTDGSFYLKPAQRTQLLKRDITIVTKRLSHLIHDRDKLLAVALKNGQEIGCDAVFTNHGFRVNNDLLLQLGCNTAKKGAALTNRRQQTNIDGVYVAGDASYDMHFVVVAAAEGVKAAVAIHNALLEDGNKEAMKVRDA